MHYYFPSVVLVFFCCLTVSPEGQKKPVPQKEPHEITYLSAADNTQQPAMFYAPKSEKPVPLLVALHTWSGNYKQTTHQECARWCMDKGWAYIHPNFRGPNLRPEATGSELVVKDILSAVEFAKKNSNIDGERIYLIGTSGGGYTALLMAGRAPNVWAGVSAWVPIVDLRAWYFECKKSGQKYFKDLEKSCGGPPGKSPAVDKEYKQRSPLTYLAKAKKVALDINTGIYDGHKGSVPVSHSLHAFNAVAAEKDKLSEEEIAFFVKEAKVPPGLPDAKKDADYGKNHPLFKRTSGQARVTIFDGGHELIALPALRWLEQQKKATNEHNKYSHR